MNKPQYNTTWIQPTRPATADDPDYDLKYKRKNAGLPSIKSDIVNHCAVPFYSVNVDLKGRVFICGCDGWVPFSVGQATDFSTFEEIFNAPQSKLIQNSVIKKEYEFCDVRYCGINVKGKKNPGNLIDLKLQLDTSCNFTCPSCRERMIFINDKNLIEEKIYYGKTIFNWLKTTDKKVMIEFAGGEPFAGVVYPALIDLYSELPNTFFVFRTNASLIKSNKKLVDKIASRIQQWHISIDAGSKEVYEKVRKNGKWNQLIENLDYLKTLPGNKSASFVIQSDNLIDTISFIKLCNRYNLKPVLDLVQDWGTWHNFDEHCVHLNSHSMYPQFVSIVKQIKEKHLINTDHLDQWIK